MSAPLSNFQKARLAQLASRAYMHLSALARGRGENPDMSTKAFAEFRRAEVIKASGKAGLRCCSQDDYKTVEAHFLHILHEDGKALKALMREQSNAQRVAEHQLFNQLTAMRKPVTYAAGICRQMFHGLGILEASPEQLHKIFLALRYQQQRENKKQNAHP